MPLVPLALAALSLAGCSTLPAPGTADGQLRVTELGVESGHLGLAVPALGAARGCIVTAIGHVPACVRYAGDRCSVVTEGCR